MEWDHEDFMDGMKLFREARSRAFRELYTDILKYSYSSDLHKNSKRARIKVRSFLKGVASEWR